MGRGVKSGAKRREYAAAERRGRKERAAGLRAERAYFEVSTQRVVIELPGGFVFGIPLATFREIRNAPAEELRKVQILGAGNILHWESLDADYSVPALITSGLGAVSIARELARRGGKTSSRAKVQAARLNGLRGGRPRKVRTDRKATGKSKPKG